MGLVLVLVELVDGGDVDVVFAPFLFVFVFVVVVPLLPFTSDVFLFDMMIGEEGAGVDGEEEDVMVMAVGFV